jgi:ribosomal protein S18 acetylase RimI-like enzyme
MSGKVLGFLSVWEPEKFIHHLYVSDEYSGQGIGSELLEFAKARYSNLSLKCMVKNSKAVHFYESRGFVRREKVEDEFGGYYLMSWGE